MCNINKNNLAEAEVDREALLLKIADMLAEEFHSIQQILMLYDCDMNMTFSENKLYMSITPRNNVSQTSQV